MRACALSPSSLQTASRSATDCAPAPPTGVTDSHTPSANESSAHPFQRRRPVMRRLPWFARTRAVPAMRRAGAPYVCGPGGATPADILAQALLRHRRAAACGLGVTRFVPPPKTRWQLPQLPPMKALHLLGNEHLEEEAMRSMIIAAGVFALAAGILAHPAAAKKSKMGCEVG